MGRKTCECPRIYPSLSTSTRNSSFGELSEPVQPRDVDTVSVSNPCGCYTDDIQHPRTRGARFGFRASTCGDVSHSEPCGVLGWQERTRRVGSKRCLFLYTHRRRLLCDAETPHTEVDMRCESRQIGDQSFRLQMTDTPQNRKVSLRGAACLK